MRSSSALITVAMLSTYLSKEHKGYLDIITPFVMNLVPKKEKAKVDKITILKGLKEEYGFEEFPTHVLTSILNSCTKNNNKYLFIENKEYYVYKIYDSKDFEKNKSGMKQSINTVLEELLMYFKENTKIKCDSIEQVKNFLIDFLDSYGLSVISEIDNLKTLTNRDYNNYHIARFILNEYEKESQTFCNVLEIVKGFFVYKSIYYFSEDQKVAINSKLRKTQVYFDTRLLIHALGYNTAEDKKATNELIRLINESGGSVKTFTHIKAEVAGILTKYAFDFNTHNTMRLEYLDINNYCPEDVIRLRDSLEINLNKIGIEVVDTPNQSITSDDDLKNRGYLDVVELKETLDKNMRNGSKHQNGTRIDNDVDSISAISLLRGAGNYQSIEKCKAILATTNKTLPKIVNGLYRDRVGKGAIGFVIDEVDLTALLWLRSFDKKSDIPCLKLLENAYAACCPTSEIIESFNNTVFKLKNEGQITDEEALLLRTQQIIKEALIISSENNPEFITDGLVLEVRNRYKEKILKDKDISIGKLKEQIETFNQLKLNAINNATEKATSASKNTSKNIKVIFRILFTILFIGGMYLIIWCNSQNSNVVVGVLLDIIAILGLFDIFRARTVFLNSFIKKKEQNKFDNVYRLEVERINEYYPDTCQVKEDLS